MSGIEAIAPGDPPGAMASRGPVTAIVSNARRRFGVLLVAATLFLIFAGAEVKSRQAGLSVPDWPLSYGMLWPPMVGNVFYEHGHRTVAAAVGLLTMILAVWTARVETRSWVRRLAWVALGAVVAQGLLGGLTVLFLLPTPISMGHALLAQTFLCLVCWLAFATSGEWRSAAAGSTADGGATSAWRAAGWAAAAVYLQLVLGALMRHTESGLAVPFFPVSEVGGWLPEYVDRHVVIHMAHRLFALVVAVTVWRASLVVARRLPQLRRHAALAAVLVVVQVLLGAGVIWTAGVSPVDGRSPIVAPVPTSLHVVTGAGLLATTWLLALRAWRADRGSVPSRDGEVLGARA
jgi:cytochrome c oxidase assembly protein subunit 15